MFADGIPTTQERESAKLEKLPSAAEDFLKTYPDLVESLDDSKRDSVKEYFEKRYLDFESQKFLTFELHSFLKEQKTLSEERELDSFLAELERKAGAGSLVDTTQERVEVQEVGEGKVVKEDFLKAFRNSVEEFLKNSENDFYRDLDMVPHDALFNQYYKAMCFDLLFILSEIGVRVDNDEQSDLNILISKGREYLSKKTGSQKQM